LLVDVQLPDHSASLSLRFERVSGLTTSSFQIAAQQIDPDDGSIAQRLPKGVFVDSRLPMLFSITRADGQTLRFHGQWTLELHTDDIDFEGETPTTRLFRAHEGGDFEDITQTVGFGSYRAGGSSGDFSEFVLVSDLRPPRQIALSKYQALQATIAAGVAA